MLQTKSRTSLIASELLKDQGIHHSSVHCAYYSCVQLAKHVLIHKLNKSGEVENKNNSIHKYIIDTVHGIIFDQVGRREAVEFHQNMTQLKTLRVQSDYQEIQIEPSQSNEAIKKSQSVIKLLNKIS